VRLKLAKPTVQAALGRGPAHFLAETPLNDAAQKELIVLAISVPKLGQLHNSAKTVPAGVPVWRLQHNSWQLDQPWASR